MSIIEGMKSITDARKTLRENAAGVRERIAAACARVGRDPASVRAVAVTKYARIEWVRELVRLGWTTLGESRPQQLVERAELLAGEPELPAVEWHLIGHLQRNKVRPVLPLVELTHSVDSLRLLERIDRIGEEIGLLPRVLLEVNVTGEPSKDGFDPAALREAWPQVTAMEAVSVEGLMTMAPDTADETVVRTAFRDLRELRDRLRDGSPPGRELPELSMGMSGDFEIGIEEGATLVRIGSALFTGLEE
jgi:pyridoxal phosphate enzyme (YggS family)